MYYITAREEGVWSNSVCGLVSTCPGISWTRKWIWLLWGVVFIHLRWRCDHIYWQCKTKPPTEFDQTPSSRAVMQYIRAVNQGGWLARLGGAGATRDTWLKKIPIHIPYIYIWLHNFIPLPRKNSCGWFWTSCHNADRNVTGSSKGCIPHLLSHALAWNLSLALLSLRDQASAWERFQA